MRWPTNLVASFLSLAAPLAAQQPFEPGLYTSRSKEGTISWQLLFCMKQGSTAYRVTGQFGDGVLAMNVDGRYEPGANRLIASTLKPEAFGLGVPVAMLEVGGFWDANSKVFTVTPAGLARENLKRDHDGPPAGVPWLQTSIDVPSPQAAGAPLRGRIKVTVRNVSAPFELTLVPRLDWPDPSATAKHPKHEGWRTLPVDDDDEYEFDLGDLFDFTAPHGVPRVTLEIATQPIGWTPFTTASIDLTRADQPVRPLEVDASIDRVAYAGRPVKFVLACRLQSPNTLDCNVRENATIEPFGDPTATLALPSQSFVARGSSTGSHVRREWEFIAPAPGDYRIRYRIEGDAMAPYSGTVSFTVYAEPTDSDTGTPPRDTKAKLSGDVAVERAVVKVGESAKTTVSLATDAGDDRDVDTVFRIRGPKGDVVSERIKRYTVAKGEKKERVLDLRFAAPGEYTIELIATGDRVETLRRSAIIKVEKEAKPPPPTTGETGATTNPSGELGYFGLVEKKVGHAASPGDGPEGVWVGSLTESTCNLTYTAKPPREGVFTLAMNWSQPPPTLKPGDVLELTCSANATKSGKDVGYVGDGPNWDFSGSCEKLERKGAFAGYASDGKFYPSSEGKSRIKIDSGGGGKIRIWSYHASIVWGTDGDWTNCIYTYEWNKPPMVTTPPKGEDEDDTGTTEEEGPGGATITPVPPDDDESKQIRARIDAGELVLFAGEPSKIVHVYISNYRRDTAEDRVEVVFPQKTDNWAALPGQIVVGGGNGSYWPPNMATPEHADGYFFSARQTARGGTFTIWWVVQQKGAGAVRIPMTVRVVARPGRLGGAGNNLPGGVTSTDGGQRALPVGAVSPFEGEWVTDVGRLVLKVTGNKVTGMLNDIAPVDGTVEGNKVTWHFSTNAERNGELDLSPDGKTWEGFYWEPDPSGRFKMFITGRRPGH